MKSDKIYLDQYYHILNRGNEKQVLFYSRENYLFFLKRLNFAIDKYGAEIICYCLMPNHFHLIIKEIFDGSISKTMLSLQTSYAKAINKQCARIGHLFQDSYQFILVERNEYLLHLSRYIHLNPVMARLVEDPEDWEFSSYRDFVGLRNGRLPNSEIVLSQFQDRSAYRDFVIDGKNEKVLGKLTLE